MTVNTKPCLFRVHWGGPIGEEFQCIYLPPLMFNKLIPNEHKPITLKVGTFETIVKLKKLSSNSVVEPVIFISPDLSAHFEIPIGQTITMKYISSLGILSLGPLIGLFTVRNILPDSEYGSQEPVLAALTNSAEDIDGLVYVFCPEDIDWNLKTVNGAIPVKSIEDSLCWRRLTLPLPDIVYDRLPSRSIEARPEIQAVKSELQELGLTYFNPMFLDKWVTHSVLEQVPEVAGYLPPTKLLEDPVELQEFIDTYKSVFLKPSAGSLGRRIIKISSSDGLYSFTYRSRDKQTVKGETSDFYQLINLLKPIMGKRNYIMQKDVKLALYEDCTFDIRVLMQKDRFGRWRRTKIYVRAAAPDSFLSNLSDGARPRPINTVLQNVFHTEFSDKQGLGEAIRIAVKTIPHALERATGMVWAELGIDLGLDTSGRIWLIEVNSKPFRTLVSKSGSLEVIRRSLLRPLEFAKFLAGFYNHSPIAGLSASS